MPKDVRARITLPSRDATVDNPSISFSFHSDAATNFANISAVTDACIAFINTAGTGGANAIANYLHRVLNTGTNLSTVEVYDITGHLDGSPAGSPVAIVNFTLGTPAAHAGIPEGCAATVSFRADYGTDVEFGPGTRPRSRDRNRVYVGPLNNAAIVDDVTTNRTMFASAFMTDALAALFDLSDTHTSGGEDWDLVVWSRVNAGVKTPILGFMDPRVDYQRRRSDPDPTQLVSRALAAA